MQLNCLSGLFRLMRGTLNGIGKMPNLNQDDQSVGLIVLVSWGLSVALVNKIILIRYKIVDHE